jgi:hypothetical protein
MSRTGFLGALCLATAVVAGSAAADGLPVLGIDVGTKGVVAARSGVRYVTIPAGPDTVVARTAVHGGRVLRYTRLRGIFTIPAVAYDGSAGGLSGDGRTLVLIQPRVRFPRATTGFAVYDAARLKLLQRIRLRGDFSFDAVSPNGHTLYLIKYLSATDPTAYEVRAYDLVARRLLVAPIVDPRERGEAMHGQPLTRAVSRDGRWAYTLYDGAGATPFVHALDTAGKTARCVDLPMLKGDLSAIRLSVSGRQIRVGTAAAALAVIDTASFRVRRAG